MKFADDYQEARNRQKKGEAAKLWKKEKYRRAKVTYKGYYSKAIFTGSCLSTRKSGSLFLGNHLACLIVGVAVGYMAFTETGMDLQMKQFFLVPIASAYVTFIFSGYLTKWAKEMESPYTYLIPDKPIRKLWYATLIEHIRSAADGLLVTLPAAVVLGLPLGIYSSECFVLRVPAGKQAVFFSAQRISSGKCPGEYGEDHSAYGWADDCHYHCGSDCSGGDHCGELYSRIFWPCAFTCW